MGRSAGWLAYGAAIAGEASLVISVEDINGNMPTKEEYVRCRRPASRRTRTVMNVDEVIKRIVPTMRDRENGRQGVRRDRDGRRAWPNTCRQSTSKASRATSTATSASRRSSSAACSPRWSPTNITRQTGRKRKVTGLQLGYEARCAKPHAFDVMLGSQLGVGAYRALVEERLNGVMVSVPGQLELNYVAFEKLVDPRRWSPWSATCSPNPISTAWPVPGDVRQQGILAPRRAEVWAVSRARQPTESPLSTPLRSKASGASQTSLRKRPLRAGHARHSRVRFDGHAQ